MDPFTIAAVTGPLLTEGIKFLYGQASDVIKRWRDRRSQIEDSPADTRLPEKELALSLGATLPDIFQGQLAPPEIHYEQVEKVYGPLTQLRKELLAYQDGGLPIDPKDPNLVKNVDALRQVLELIYQQRITFKGEAREPSGAKVITIVEVKQVLGNVVGLDLDLDEIPEGTYETNVKSDLVGPGGNLTGTRIKQK